MDDGPIAPQSKRGTRKRTSSAPPTNGRPLRQEIRDALLLVLRDASAPATAKASAARTLAEFFFAEEDAADAPAPVTSMKLEDIDAEIARYGQLKRDSA